MHSPAITAVAAKHAHDETALRSEIEEDQGDHEVADGPEARTEKDARFERSESHSIR